MKDQFRNVFATLAQRRYFDADHVQAVQQILAEHVLFHAFFQRLVRGCDHAHIDAHGHLAADAIELAFGQYAQQAGLQLRRHVADFIEEQRAAVGLFEAAATQCIGAGERTFFVTEQFGLEQIRSECGRVQRDEGLAGARAVTMQGAGDQFLARAGFAGDQHGHAGARQPADGAKHFLHRRRLSQHFGNAARFGADFFDAFLLLGCATHQVDGLIDVERLRQVFEGAALVRGDGAVEIRVRRHHDHRQLRLAVVNLGQQFEAAAAGHANVGDQHIGSIASQRRERRVGVIERGRRHASLAQRALEHPADGGIVVDEPDIKRLDGHLEHGMAAGW